MDWSKLSFGYTKTKTILVCHYKNGKWGEITSCTDDNLSVSSLSAGLHYGLQCFEGLKAFNCEDGKVRIFRPDQNAARMIRSAKYLGIPYPDKELFTSMVSRAVKENIDFIPPHDVEGSLYIRPLLIGSEPQLSLTPSEEATFIVITNPVGAYNGQVLQPCRIVISREYDRSAPNGSGSYKVGGNYAMAMSAGVQAKKAGFSDVLYLDAKTHKYIEEFSTSNFFAIKDNTYITPLSKSILPSITNKSLEVIASDLGLKVERREILLEELSTFEEVGGCGTAVVITPIASIEDRQSLDSPPTKVCRYDNTDEIGNPTCGAVSTELYKTLTGIQRGKIMDKHDWNLVL